MVTGLLEELDDVKTLEAETSVEGLAMAASHRPDLILLDLSMPEIDGSEVFARLKSNPVTEDIPVVIFTGVSKWRSRLFEQAFFGPRAFQHCARIQESRLTADVSPRELIPSTRTS